MHGEGGLYSALGAAAVRENFEYRAEVVAGRFRLTGESLADDFTAAIAGAFFGPDAALRIEYRATWGILPATIVGISFRF